VGRKNRRNLAVVLALALVAGACGGRGDVSVVVGDDVTEAEVDASTTSGAATTSTPAPPPSTRATTSTSATSSTTTTATTFSTTTSSSTTVPAGGDANGGEALSVLSLGEGSNTLLFTPRPSVGETWSGTLLFEQQISFVGPGAPPSTRIPVAELPVVVEVVDVTPTGTITAVSTYGLPIIRPDDGVDPSVSASFGEVMTGLNGVSVTASVDASGVTGSVEVSVPDGTDPALVDQLGLGADLAAAFSVPLPSVPLGVGAVWSTSLVVPVQGLASTIVTFYEVVEIDGDRYRADVTYEQVMDGSVVSEGLVVTMLGTISGSGTLYGDVTEPMPIESRVVASGTIAISSEGESLDMVMEIGVRISGE